MGCDSLFNFGVSSFIYQHFNNIQEWAKTTVFTKVIFINHLKCSTPHDSEAPWRQDRCLPSAIKSTEDFSLLEPQGLCKFKLINIIQYTISEGGERKMLQTITPYNNLCCYNYARKVKLYIAPLIYQHNIISWGIETFSDRHKKTFKRYIVLLVFFFFLFLFLPLSFFHKVIDLIFESAFRPNCVS